MNLYTLGALMYKEAETNQAVSMFDVKQASIGLEPHMFLTVEENKILDSLLTKHAMACNNCCPVR